MVEPHSLNFRLITTNVLGVRIFRKFNVLKNLFQGRASVAMKRFRTETHMMKHLAKTGKFCLMRAKKGAHNNIFLGGKNMQ